jgi:hypothetical protein
MCLSLGWYREKISSLVGTGFFYVKPLQMRGVSRRQKYTGGENSGHYHGTVGF